MTHDFKDQLWFLAAIAGGLAVSMLTSARHSFWLAVTRIAAGMFCSVFFTDSVMAWMGLSPETYRNSVAGLLAMTGYAFVRILSNIGKQDIIDLIKVLRGSK